VIEEHNHEYRVGIGTDVHRLILGKKLMLGGVHIPFDMGLKGHSDGDVVLHAVIDAMLGASGNDDIGTLFPDTDPSYKDADSKGLVLSVKELIFQQGWEVVNVDLVIHTEVPRLEPYKKQIKRCVSSLLGIDFNATNVKAKTNEGLDEIGQGAAIAVTAVTLLKKKYRRTL
jgi:2-C-methyl-D-erythritol 2,4-cyclodiphosphate synthase